MGTMAVKGQPCPAEVAQNRLRPLWPWQEWTPSCGLGQAAGSGRKAGPQFGESSRMKRRVGQGAVEPFGGGRLA